MAFTGRPNVTDAERKRMKDAVSPKSILYQVVKNRLKIIPDTKIAPTQQ